MEDTCHFHHDLDLYDELDDCRTPSDGDAASESSENAWRFECLNMLQDALPTPRAMWEAPTMQRNGLWLFIVAWGFWEVGHGIPQALKL